MRRIALFLFIILTLISNACAKKSILHSISEYAKTISKKAKAEGYTFDKYPSPYHAWIDFQSNKTFTISKEFWESASYRLTSYTNSFRLPYTINWPEMNMYNIKALVVQMTVRYESKYKKGELETKMINYMKAQDSTFDVSEYGIDSVAKYLGAAYDATIGAYAHHDKVYIYYIQDANGEWHYRGAETRLTGFSDWDGLLGLGMTRYLIPDDKATIEKRKN